MATFMNKGCVATSDHLPISALNLTIEMWQSSLLRARLILILILFSLYSWPLKRLQLIRQMDRQQSTIRTKRCNRCTIRSRSYTLGTQYRVYISNVTTPCGQRISNVPWRPLYKFKAQKLGHLL